MKEDFTTRKLLVRLGCVAGLVVAMAISAAMTGPGEDKRLIRKADEAFALEDYKMARLLYLRATEATPANAEAHYKLGIVYVQLNQPAEAKQSLQEAIRISPNVQSKVLLYLAEAHQQDHEFALAKGYYEAEQKKAPAMDKAYQRLLQRRVEECEAGLVFMQNPAKCSITSVGAAINSEFSDYVPVLIYGGRAMLYTTRRPGRTLGLAEAAGVEQIRVSKLKAGEWRPSELFLEPQRQMPYHAVVSVVSDGKELYTFFAEKGLHSSRMLDNGQWTYPEQLKAPLNRGYREPSIYLTDDGKFAFFSSDRAGGYGGLDIYVCYKNANGTWSEALNLGPEVNTAYDEDAPFIDFQANALYFSSRGHNSMGGYDVFRSSIAGGKWSNAVNLGYPINSATDDLYYILHPDRNQAYVSSDRPGGLGGKDIYSISCVN